MAGELGCIIVREQSLHLHKIKTTNPLKGQKERAKEETTEQDCSAQTLCVQKQGLQDWSLGGSGGKHQALSLTL